MNWMSSMMKEIANISLLRKKNLSISYFLVWNIMLNFQW
jgi:hypothetical protein